MGNPIAKVFFDNSILFPLLSLEIPISEKQAYVVSTSIISYQVRDCTTKVQQTLSDSGILYLGLVFIRFRIKPIRLVKSSRLGILPLENAMVYF